MEKKVEPYLEKAAQVAEQIEGWRKDRIRVRIAETHTWLGRSRQAQAFAAGVEDSQTGKVARVEAMICPADSFDERTKTLEALVSAESFDIVRNALEAYLELYGRFHADAERRTLVEKKIRTSWGKMPTSVQIDLLMEWAESSLAHEDRPKALELVHEAKTMVDSTIWQPRLGIPVRARLAALLFRAGDEEQARIGARDALNIFDANREKIVNIYRAEVLRSVAEAHQAMGETDIARGLYKRAIEAGIENPNSRPRAEDLTATCCSMALHAVEPGAKLLSRIREIRDGLGDPW
jgi:tetratricopeptide (TPR) repeat protein